MTENSQKWTVTMASSLFEKHKLLWLLNVTLHDLKIGIAHLSYITCICVVHEDIVWGGTIEINP